MRGFRLRSWRAAAAGVVVGLVFGGMVVAQAATTAPTSNTFYACLKTGSLVAGSLSVNTPPNCGGGSTLVQWNQNGLQGAQGPTGPTGPAGATGPQGPS